MNDKNLQTNTLSFSGIKSIINSRKAYAALEGSILTAAQGEEKKTFLITSSVPGEGKTFSSLMMAQALATHSNATVLLIEGNFNKPQLNSAFNLSPKSELGVAEYFSSSAEEAKDFVIKTEDENIFLMPFVDNKKPNIERCFYHASFAAQLEKLKHTGFDYILLDGTAVLAGSEALAIAKFFDSVILVVECEKTKWEVVQLASEKLAQVKAKQLGVVLNKRSYPIPPRFYS